MQRDLIKLEVLQAGIENALRISDKFDFESLEKVSHYLYAQNCLEVLRGIPKLLSSVQKIIVSGEINHEIIPELAHSFDKINYSIKFAPDEKEELHLDILVLRQYLQRISIIMDEIDLVSFILNTCVRMR